MSLTTLVEAILGGLAGGALHALLALPFAIVLRLARALNLAHGELVILGGYVAYAAWRAWGCRCRRSPSWPPSRSRRWASRAALLSVCRNRSR